MKTERSGAIAAIAAFVLWGSLPVYWKQLGDFLPPADIVAQRTLWSLAVLLLILLVSRSAKPFLQTLRSPRSLAWLLLSGTLLAVNWILYVWATLNGHIIESALGYYLNPFLNMLFGALWFGERHNRIQLTAIAIALCGVALQIPAVNGFPWVAITLALTFSLYGVVKKQTALGSRLALTTETTLLAPVALGWLVLQHSPSSPVFGGSPARAALIIGTGLATTLPLLFFGYAARRIRLSTLGILQFVAPTLQFLIGWKLYGEPMAAPRLFSFILIWTAVAIYGFDAARSARIRSGSPTDR